MKRLFTFAIIATMIASFTFAQSPKAMKAAPKKIEKVAEVKANLKKANEMKSLKADQAIKASTVVEKGQTVLRTSKKTAGRSIKDAMQPIVTKGITSLKLAKNAAPSRLRAAEQEGNVTVTRDEHGIITDVTGVAAKYYTRSDDGTAYTNSSGGMSPTTQSGTVTVVEDGDNVYIKNPITLFSQNSWVKGVKADGKVTVATRQPLAYNGSYDATISLRWGVITAAGNILAADDIADAFTFAVDGDVWTLEGTVGYVNAAAGEDAPYMGAFWDDDNTATGYGDAETVLTLDSSYIPPSTELVEAPETATVEDWYLNGEQVDSTKTTKIKNQEICVAFDGNDIYVQGIDEEFPASWIKGTNNNGVVTFEKFQYVGNYAGEFDIWVIGYNEETGEICDLTATYDAAEKTITFNEPIIFNADANRIYYLSWYQNVVLSDSKKVYEEPIINELTSDLPYENSFDTEAEQKEVGIYDANDDDRTFVFYDGKLRYNYSSANPGDDYAVFPGLPLEAGKKYYVAVDAWAYLTSFPERFEVVAGTVAKASQLNITVIPPTDLTSDESTTFSNTEFEVEEDGVYYFAIHAISDADEFYAYFDNFVVKAEDPESPKPVADLTVAPAEDASLKATVSFTVSDKTVEDVTLTEDLDVIVKRDGEEIMNEKKAPGAAVEFVDMVSELGTHTYVVQLKNGEHVSDIAKASAYIGEDVPDMVENLAVADKVTSIDLTWDAPSAGENGGIVLVNNLKYNVYPVDIIEFWGMLFPEVDYDNPYATGLTDTKATVEMNTLEGEQDFAYVAVDAENEAGASGAALGAFVKGAPYAIPYAEKLENGSLSSFFSVNQDDASYDNQTANIYLDLKPGSDEDAAEYCFQFVAEEAAWLQLETGKIALAGAANPVVKFNACGDETAALEVIALTPDGAKSLGNVALGSDYAAKSLSLVEFKDAAWVRVFFKVTFTGEGEAYLGDLKVFNELDNNLAALAINAPTKVKAGDAVKVSVVVENQGKNEVAKGAYYVELNCNDEKVASLEGEALASDEKATVEFEVPTTILSPETLTFKAVVNYQADEDQANNATGEVTTKVVLANLPAPEELTGASTDGAIKLEWKEPTIEGGAAEEVTEDFEDAEGFSWEYGDWTFVDKDGGLLGNSQGGIPGIVNGVTTGAFNIWDNTNEVVAGYDVEPLSGDKCLFAIFNSDGSKQSDWAISPELCGDAQTISFWAQSFTVQYGAEVVSVYYSTGSLEPDEFVKVEGSTKNVPDTWTEYSYELPAGAKYFAIVCESQDAYMLFIDDVTFTPAGAGANLELAGYNVYRDGVKINEAIVEETTYADANVEEKVEYSYVVSAVYTEKGESPASNEVVVTYDPNSVKDLAASGKLGIYAADGKIVVLNAEGKQLTVSAANGAVVYDSKGAQKTTINVAAGVYVVKAGKSAVKVVVK